MIEDMEYLPGETPLDPDEMDGLKFTHIETRGQLDELEQANIDNGMLWLGRQRNPNLLNDHFVRQLHEKLFGEVWQWAGTYRLTEKNIGIDPFQISVQLRQLLDNVHFWVENETYEPMEVAARFHHSLVYIHLFPNGNGRHARIMADALLEVLYGSDPIDWSGGYDLQRMNERRDQYINALRAADAGDYTLLFQFIGWKD